MDARNALFYGGRLAVLDLSARRGGGAGGGLRRLLHPGTAALRTVYESAFGRPLADVFFFPPPGDGGIAATAAALGAHVYVAPLGGGGAD